MSVTHPKPEMSTIPSLKLRHKLSNKRPKQIKFITNITTLNITFHSPNHHHSFHNRILAISILSKIKNQIQLENKQLKLTFDSFVLRQIFLFTL